MTDAGTDAVLAINAGSSSLKFALFATGPAQFPQAQFRGLLEGIGTDPHLLVHDANGATLAEQRWGADAARTHEDLLETLIAWIETHLAGSRLIGIGHRVVHGGADFTAPVRLNDDVVAALEKLTPLAPLHQPHSLSPVRAFLQSRPDLPQIACFDTAFHHTIPAVATRLPLPRAYAQAGVRRYGFHGLSYEYIALKLQQIAPDIAAKRVIVAHLGNGASLCATRNGQSIDTTTGFTALDGLVMGTRCGSLDPGVVLYLLQQRAMSAHDIEDLLYRKSGLLGLSGLSSDMRDLLASPDPAAREAICSFVYRLARETGGMAAALGGLDGFVFTAGIGEHAAKLRELACEKLSWLGITLDRDANARHAAVISAPGSRVVVRVIPTDEEWMIARHSLDLLAAPAPDAT
jgi:acetate kinase